ncbi:hypothetical protein QNO07_05035 [Streptomyces sp. 549]|uniref:hypothetical protein n=1 Tax=Streptomyces sp. 549 TaxID=3049076 RepID=UPI0024C2D795|nr:hypothetical protein [Streptomyces sp. 549]MDK1472799.1 hypothetical protein [Streptomyces sp. 549]
MDTSRDKSGDTVPGERRSAHRALCDCAHCPHSAVHRYREALAGFLRRRDELVGGGGVPAALAHSPAAARQWVSDELTLAAVSVADRARDVESARPARQRQRAVAVVWAAVVLLLAAQAVTAARTGWTDTRTAALLAAVATASVFTLAVYRQRAADGVPAPLLGDDNRLSTSRAVATGWVLLTAFAVLMAALRLAVSGADGAAGLAPERGAALLAVLALTCAVAVAGPWLTASRVRSGRSQKVPAERPRAVDLVTDDAGRGSFPAAQYLLCAAVSLGYATASLVREPDRLPDLPWGLVLLTTVSAAVHLTGRLADAGPPVVLSVVRARAAGDLDASIRPGDDIEIRGAGFVPPGAQPPHLLARTIVRIGPVHAHVPLIPVRGGFVNPADTALRVPVPAEVEPGTLEVQVVTAAGAESNRYTIEVTD